MEKQKIKIINVAGARPNFMKMASIIKEMREYADSIDSVLLHTGQHYDKDMSKSFFDDLEIPKPDIDLEVGSGSHADQTALIMTRFEKCLLKENPDLVLVVGDINSTLACSITASKLCIPVAHVESGLRSFDRKMPEEINRIVTDSLSDYLFTTCKDANENLRKEGASEEKIFFVGNVMIDTLLRFKVKAELSSVLEDLGLDGRPYILVTLHRPSNVDDKETFIRIIAALRDLSKEHPIILSVHPRTKKQIELFNLQKEFQYISNKHIPLNGICIVKPFGYLDFLCLMSNAKLVLTDSGGIQEETTILNIPCITIRENTERPITIREGTNVLVGTDYRKIVDEGLNVLNGLGKSGNIPELWDGRAGERIVSILREKLSG